MRPLKSSLGKDFLGAIVGKVPPCPFEKVEKYHGEVHSYRLLAIDPRVRNLLVSCQVEREFHPPVAGPVSERMGRSPQTPKGGERFASTSGGRVNIEPGIEGVPRFRIEIEEVKRRELDGFSGVVARFLGKYFDELVTRLPADWRCV